MRISEVAKYTKAMISPEAYCYGDCNIEIGEGSRIDHGCIFTGKIKIGKRVHIAPYSMLYGKAGIEIGDYSGFGVFTVMHSESDDYSGESMFGPCVPMEYQPKKLKAPIEIGQHVLGGARVTILPGVRIGNGVSMGAHSLIKGDCLPWTIYAGIPAKAIKPRGRTLLTLCRQFEASL